MTSVAMSICPRPLGVRIGSSCNRLSCFKILQTGACTRNGE